MSFLHDKNILDKLIASLTKSAQEAPGLSPTDVADARNKDTIAIAKKLVAKLAAELAGNVIQPNITSATDTDLNVQSLQNIDVFLQFLANNKVMIDGQRIVLSKDEFEAANRPEGFYPFSSKTKRVDTDQDPSRQWSVVDFLANKQLLIQYVQYLQKKAISLKESANPDQHPYGQVLEVMLGKLINNINSSFSGTGLTKITKSEPGKPKELPEDTEIDSFGSKIINTLSPHDDTGGPIKLLAKDLKSVESLNSWLASPPVAQVIVRAGQQLKTLKFGNPSEPVDPCSVLRVLFTRAKAQKQTSTSEDMTKAKNFYMQRMEELAPKFMGADGKACSLTDLAGTGAGAGAGQSGAISGQPGTSGTGGAGGKPDVKEQEQQGKVYATILSALPFTMNDVNLNRIEGFISAYEDAVKPQSNDEFFQNKNRIVSLINEIRRELGKNKASASDFVLTRDAVQFSYYASIPASRYYIPLIDALKEIVSTTKAIIQPLYNNAVSHNLNNAAAQLKSQLAIGQDNFIDLDDLRRRSNEVIKPGSK